MNLRKKFYYDFFPAVNPIIAFHFMQMIACRKVRATNSRPDAPPCTAPLTGRPFVTQVRAYDSHPAWSRSPVVGWDLPAGTTAPFRVRDARRRGRLLVPPSPARFNFGVSYHELEQGKGEISAAG